MSTYEEFVKYPEQKLLLDAEYQELLFQEASEKLSIQNRLYLAYFGNPTPETRKAFIEAMFSNKDLLKGYHEK